ncbi:SDR family NAD(P)-dependent oxidoreductase [Nonomuraea sp. 10N515B]|uniref:SDR family NAD(P)-dependent oxidoreductase n=1 Tax=Nonomuraea sp. 10N515B TaxID=3457422 RepID=UPI003FCCDD0C
MRQLNERVAVVTGGASGIGRGLVNQFAAEGMKVVIADIEKGPLDHAVSEVVATGAEAIGVVTDVADRAAVENLAAATMDAFGAVHVLCNNAGVETGGAFQDIPLAGWRWVIEVNLFGVIHGCQVFLPLLRQQEEGHIVNTASVAAFDTGTPTMAPYTASKCAVLGLSENLALELRAAGAHIGVSLLAPGFVRTRIPDAERNLPAGVPSANDATRKSVLDFMATMIKTQGLDPAAVAEHVVKAIRENRFYVLTHPDMALTPMRRRLAWMESGDMTENL